MTRKFKETVYERNSLPRFYFFSEVYLQVVYLPYIHSEV